MLKAIRGDLRRVSYLVLLLTFTHHATCIIFGNGKTSSPTAAPTCPARSLNYITESLPQQCLKTPWPGSARETSSSTESIKQETTDQTVEAGQVTITATLLPPNITKSRTSDSATLPDPADLLIHTSTESVGPTREKSHRRSSTEATDSENEGESPLDNANFLSFEDWKRQNLAKAGQSADQVGTGRPGIGEGEARRRPGSINNALDALGEDTEIDIDFGGFANQAPNARAVPITQAEGKRTSSKHGDFTDADVRLGDISRPHARSKDAGKTCKERSNYASFDCAATVLKTNPECKGSTSPLVENKDSYLLNECSAKNKFLIVELCNDILVDTVVLANFEFFSSMFKTFKVSVSDRYPVKLDKWRELGTFEARNSRQVQAFLVENPLIWARYLRIEFLTHFGNEFYCPVSLLRIHGTTMMEEFNYDMKGLRIEDDPDGEVEGSEKNEEKASDVVTAENIKSMWPSTPETILDTERPTATQTHVPSPTPLPQPQKTPESSDTQPTARGSILLDSLLRPQMESVFAFDVNSSSFCKAGDGPTHRPSVSPTSVATTLATEELDYLQHITLAPSSTGSSPLTTMTSSITTLSPSAPASQKSTISKAVSSSSIQSERKSSTDLTQSVFRNPSTSTRASPSSVQPPPSNPTTQESFFKSVYKRLQLLESNSTLSLQYIEEQSRILRDAFAKVEKRQLAKTTAFLDTLNNTVTTELRDFRHQYDQLWQSTVLELSSQREQSQQEIVALSSRLSILADEVVFQRRIAILQFLLILVCLGLVLFSRSSSSVATYLELPPLVQHAFNKSSSSLSKYTTHFDTPPASPSSTRPPSRYGIFRRGTPSHGRGPSGGSPPSDSDGRKSPNTEYSPPTPTSQQSDHTDHPQNSGEVIPLSIDVSSRQAQSSPVAPNRRRVGERNELLAGDYLKPA